MDELPSDALYDLARPMRVAVSPDGDRVAFQSLEYDEADECRRSSVFTVPADGSRDPHRFTRTSDAGAMKWSPDGSKLGVVMTRERDVELRVGRGDEEGTSDEEGTGDEESTENESGSDAESETDGEAETDEETEIGDESVNGDESENGDEEGPDPQLWVYDLELGGDARQVTDRDHGIRDFDWGPAGERVVVSARDPTEEEREYLAQRREDGPIETERLQHKMNGQGWLDTVTTYLFVVDVETREERRLDDAYGGGILEHDSGLQPAWHPTEDRVTFCSYRGEDGDDTYVQDVYLVDVETGDVERVTDGEYAAMAPTWSPDGSRLAFTAADPRNLYVPTDVCVAEADTGEYRVVTESLDRSLCWFERVVWLDDGRLLTAIGDGGWSRFVGLSATGGHERVFDRQSREASVAEFDADGGTVAFARTHPREGMDVYAVDASDLDGGREAARNGSSDAGTNAESAHRDSLRRLTDLNPALLADYDHPHTRRVGFDGAEGDAVEGVAFYPPAFDPDDPDGDRPLLLSVHGGPRRYDFPYYDFDATYWTTRGYVVFKVNFHGSTSYGRAFCERLQGRWNDVEVTDLLAGTGELVERGWVDPDRLFVTGFSYGGKATAWLLAESDRFAAGAAEHGVYDARSTFGTSDAHHWSEIEFGLPWENPDEYDAASSITDVDDIDTPLLLTAGEEDWRCPPTQSEQLHVSLRKRGVASKLVVYPDTHHVHYYVAGPDRAIHRLETLESWFERFDPGREVDDATGESDSESSASDGERKGADGEDAGGAENDGGE